MPFHLDTFTAPDGTRVDDHSPDVGDGPYESMAFQGSGDATVTLFNTIASNRVDGPATNSPAVAVSRAPTVPPSAEYTVESETNTVVAQQSNRRTFMYARMSPTGTAKSEVDFYAFELDCRPSGGYRIWKHVSGTVTQLAFEQVNLADQQFRWRAVVTDARKSLERWDGTEWVEQTFTTDNEITQVGRIGLCGYRIEFSRGWIDNFTAETIGPAGPPWTLNTGTVGQGTVDVDPDEPEYDDNDPVELTATPAPGWEADDPLWTGDVDPADADANPVTVVMDQNRTVVANFVPIELDPPTNVQVVGTGSGSAEVTWDPVQDATHHQVEARVRAGVGDPEALAWGPWSDWSGPGDQS